MDEETYSAPQAARILRLSRQRVTQMLNAGELEGTQDESGRWRVPQRAVHERLKDRPARGRPDDQRGPQSHEELASATEGLAELQARLEDLSYRLGRSEARAELTERAESTVREERDRLLRELEEERAERRRLQAELEERRRSWWSKLFRR